jgi:Fe-S oxidoreductase
MKEESGAQKMRAIVEETLEIVREYKGSHSGEHGDGLSRSEFHLPMFGQRMVNSFEEVKDSFDPTGTFNPGKIVRPPKMDDRSLFRFAPGYSNAPIATTMDWSDFGSFNQALEMCNNNGACRKSDVAVMCPSFRVSGDEQHLTRGRANTLRLAVSGQLGPEALASHAMFDTMSLCVSCKGCKRECPTGIDMAKMKIEFLHQYYKKNSLSLKDRLVAYLPRYAYRMRNLSFLLNLRDQIPGLKSLSELVLGFSARRSLPKWRSDQFRAEIEVPSQLEISTTGKDVVLLVDTFNSCFEPENARAALAVLTAAGYSVHAAEPADKARPLCCGRTFLSSGMVDEARVEAQRVIASLKPFVEKGIPIVGLEPSCLLTLRDEFPSLLPGDETTALSQHAFLFEEFLAAEEAKGELQLKLKSLPAKRALLHGHCHQKAFAVMSSVQQVLAMVPELVVETVESSCCGMAGSFGYDAKHFDTSMKMGELSLLPAIREADADCLIVADGTSCRHQIQDGAGREAIHVARVLEMALVE